MLGRDLAMRAHDRIKHHGVHVAEGGGAYDQLQRVHEAEYIVDSRVFELEAHDRAIEPMRELLPDRLGIGMRRVRREVDALNARMAGQRGCHAAGAGALPLHAQREGLYASHRQITLEGTEDRTDNSGKTAHGFQMRFIGDGYASEYIAVARQILGN